MILADVIVHIGMPKTGTTSLQRFCTLNAPVLQANGLHYPKPVSHSNYQHKSVAMYAGFKFRLFRSRQEQKELATEIGLLRDSIQNSEGTTLISSEWLYGVNPKNLTKIFPPGRTQIIIYLRDQVNYLTSYYQEVVTLFPVTQRVDDFVKTERNLNFARIVNRWAKVFGEDNLTVRIYGQNHLFKGNIIDDFFQTIRFDLTNSNFNFNTGSTNPSLGGELLEFKRVLNRVLESPKEQRIKLRHALKVISANHKKFQIKPRISQEIKDQIIEKYDVSNHRLFRSYGFDGPYFDYAVHGDGMTSDLEPLQFFEILEMIRQEDKAAYQYIADRLYNNAIFGTYSSFDKLKTLLSYL